MRLTRLLFVALFPLGLVACASHQPPVEAPVDVEGLTSAHVLNRNAFPVTIYLVQAAMKYRLGTVESMSAGLFIVPPRLLSGRSDFRLVASPLGPHQTYVSGPFVLQPGQTADWRLQESSDVRISAVSMVTIR